MTSCVLYQKEIVENPRPTQVQGLKSTDNVETLLREAICHHIKPDMIKSQI